MEINWEVFDIHKKELNRYLNGAGPRAELVDAVMYAVTVLNQLHEEYHEPHIPDADLFGKD